MMYGMTAAYGLSGQTPGIPGQGPPLHGQGAGLAGQPPMAVAPHLTASMSTPASTHPQMSFSRGTKALHYLHPLHSVVV